MARLRLSIIVLLVTFAWPAKLFGQIEPPPDLPAAVNPPPEAGVVVPVSIATSGELWLALVIVLFGVTIVGVQYLLLRGFAQDKITEFSQLLIVTLIIIGTLLLVASGFDSTQIAPALGLFGTIAGYLLGRRERSGPENKQE